MRTGGLNEILRTLLNNTNDEGISSQELIWLLHKIEDDATEIGHAKYDLCEKIRFSIDRDNNSDTNPLGRQSATSLKCIRRALRKNLDLMPENLRDTFRSYLIECGEKITNNDM
jgi:hypothetical protein